MTNISKMAEEYVLEHPSIKDCLKNDLINFSSLSRQIIRELHLNQKNDFDAVLIACRRLQSKLKKDGAYEKNIVKILKESKIEIKNKIIVVVLEKDIVASLFYALEKEVQKKKLLFRVIEGASGITIITSEDVLDLIKKYFRNKIIVESKNLAEIIIKSPEEIESTPGAYAYLCSILGENNINIVETLSCWTDTIFIIDEKDVGKAMGLMRF